MPDPAERFIAAATAPLADNAEMQVMAAQELQALVAENEEAADGRCDSLEACAARLESSPRVSLRSRMTVPIMACIALALAGITASHFYRYRHLFSYYKGSLSMKGWAKEELLAPHPSPAQSLLLFGDSSMHKTVGRWKALCDSSPQDVCYFARYAETNYRESRKLPPSYRETVARLDPDNGYFAMLEAAASSRGAVQYTPQQRKRGVPRPIPTYLIKDQARLDEAVASMQQAATMADWRSYKKDLLRSQFSILPAAKGLLEGMSVATYFDREGLTTTQIDSVVAAKAEQLVSRGDREGFGELIAAWEQAAPRWVESQPDTLESARIGRNFLKSPLANLKAGAEAFGMREAAAKYQARAAAVAALEGGSSSENWASKMRVRQLSDHGSYRIWSSSIAESYLGYGHNEEPLHGETLAPGRRAEFELLYQAASFVSCMVFAITALAVAIYRFRGGLMACRLSREMERLVTTTDRIWIIVGGSVAPFLAWQLLCRFTPLGVKDWSPLKHSMIVPVGQWLACLVVMLALPLIFTRWRLGRRAGRILPQVHRAWCALAFPGLSVAAIPLFWVAFKISLPDGIFSAVNFVNLDIADASEPERTILWTATGLIASTLGWLAIVSIRVSATSSENMLVRMTTSRVLVQCYTAAMLVTALALPFFRLMEQHWTAHDELTRVTADSVPTNPYETALAHNYRQRLLDIFKPEE